MAAAANLVEAMYSSPCEPEYPELNDLKTALFAAQHSKPRETPEHLEARVLDAIAGYPSLDKPKKDERECLECSKTKTQDSWHCFEHLAEFKAKQVEAVLDTCLGGCECPKCGMESDYPLKRCTKCYGDGVTQCQCEVKKA